MPLCTLWQSSIWKIVVRNLPPTSGIQPSQRADSHYCGEAYHVYKFLRVIDQRPSGSFPPPRQALLGFPSPGPARVRFYQSRDPPSKFHFQPRSFLIQHAHISQHPMATDPTQALATTMRPYFLCYCFNPRRLRCPYSTTLVRRVQVRLRQSSEP